MIIDNIVIDCHHSPLVIPEIGINHGGSMKKAMQLVDDAYQAGAHCVKIQTHIVEDEMIPSAKDIIPPNANVSIWEIVSESQLSFNQEKELKAYVEKYGMLFISTPFSRAAVDRLEALNTRVYKIGSGECNNYPLVEYIAKKGKPIILSTGMNNLSSVSKAVNIIRSYKLDYALLQCTSIYPTQYHQVRLGAINKLAISFPDSVVGLSDHSRGNYVAIAAVALGAQIVEKHFTCNRNWKGPDIPISITPEELRDLIKGTNAVWQARQGDKEILEEEDGTIKFAYSSIVSTEIIRKGERLTTSNIFPKRPGTGEIRAEFYNALLGKTLKMDIVENTQLEWSMLDGEP